VTEEERQLRFSRCGPDGNYVALRKIIGEGEWKQRKSRLAREWREKNKDKLAEYRKKHQGRYDYAKYGQAQWERIKSDPQLHEARLAKHREQYAKRREAMPPKPPKKPKVLRSKGKFKKHRPRWRKWFAEQIERQKNRCALCRADLAKLPKDQVQVDHIVPRAEGGITEETNLWVLCRKCNLDKRAKRTHLL
jgi:5-methylcytosine-specific restriction endonuclease McrA